MSEMRALKIEGDMPYTIAVKNILAKNLPAEQLALELSDHVDGCIKFGDRTFAEGKEV
jgi:predicted lipid carrier protein YhbT